MILGIGTDLANIERIASTLDRFGPRFHAVRTTVPGRTPVEWRTTVRSTARVSASAHKRVGRRKAVLAARGG